MTKYIPKRLMTKTGRGFFRALGLSATMWILNCAEGNALGQVLFYENFQEFASGTNFPNGYSYTPSAGPAGARATVSYDSPTTVGITNLAGNNRILYNVPASSLTPVYYNDHHAYFSVPQSNQVLELTWQLYIYSLHPGTLGIAEVQLPIVGNDESTVIAFNDGGQIYGVTNVSPLSPSDLLTIGSWSNWFGTVMTNRLIMNYPAHTLTLSVNGQLIATLPMRPDLSNYVDHVDFEFSEYTAYGSLGNRFAIGQIQIAAQPSLGVSLKSGIPTLSLSGMTGANYALEYSSALGAGASWQPVLNYSNILLTNNPQSFPDTSFTGSPRRFYRARAQ